jgi:D-alanyl-D-alanine carboxypeptidase
VRRKLIVLLILIIIVAAGAWWYFGDKAQPAPVKNTSKTQQTTVKTAVSDGFDKTKYSLTDPSSIWIIVNKQHPLNPIDYAPTDLRYPNVDLRVPGAAEMQMRNVAATALEQMFAGAAAAGYKLQISTAYRGYDYQKSLYDGYVSSAGQAAADQESARPGYSEHQTGLAVDIRNQANTCSLEACFGTTPEGEWLAANAYKYGFLLRYPQGKESITGYEYEPWHFRYIGTYLSQELHKDHIQTLEEFFGVSGGTTYAPAPGNS